MAYLGTLQAAIGRQANKVYSYYNRPDTSFPYIFFDYGAGNWSVVDEAGVVTDLATATDPGNVSEAEALAREALDVP